MSSRPYTNYNARMGKQADPASVIGAVAGLRARCERGEHDESTVPDNRTVYAPFGRRRETGECYCTACGRRIVDEEKPHD